MRCVVASGSLLALVLLVDPAEAQVQDRAALRSGRATVGSGDQGRHGHDRGGGHWHGAGRRHRGDRVVWWFDGGWPWFSCPLYTPAFDWYVPPVSYFGYSVGLPAMPVSAVPFNPVGPVDPAGSAPAPADDVPQGPKTSNAELKARAGRFIGHGDTQFANQRYLAAVDRYKTAIEVAPDVAESYIRQAIAQVALGNYDVAAKTFQRALRVRADWQGSPLRLDQLYGGAPLPKNTHLEALAQAVNANPFDAELLMLLGMELFFDGQAQRSEAFFSRAAQLGANEEKLLDAFLPRPGPAGAPPAPPPGKVVF